VAYRHVWVHRSGSAPLDEWTGNGDHRFRAGLELCQRGLVEKVVEKVVEELFLVHVPGTKGRP
jgi:hypothetical protein